MAAHTIYYQSSQDLPAHRYFDLNVALFMEANAGGGVGGFMQQVQAAMSHQQEKHYDKANAIMGNMLFALASIQERQSHSETAHAAMVREYKGRDVSRMSAEEVAAMIREENLSVGKMQRLANALKKKVDAEISATHPKYAPPDLSGDIAEQEHRRTLLLLNGICNDSFDRDAIQRIDSTLLSMHEPKLVGGTNGVYIQERKKLSSLYNTLYQLGYPGPKMMPVFDFFTALEDMGKRKGR